MDRADFSGAALGVTLALGSAALNETTTSSEGDQVRGVENITGSDYWDELTGNEVANELRGQGGNDTLIGGGGADWLEGGTGADLMIGGTEDDLYFVDDAGDQVVEEANGGNRDTVHSTLSSMRLGNHIEMLTYSGTGSFFAIGNDQGNNIIATSGSGHTIYGMGGDDGITSGDGDDALYGDDGNDVIYAGGGNDRLEGGAGADILLGMAGDDTYYVDRNGEVFENANEGIDTVFADMAGGMYLLDANVENLTLQGTTFYGVGNEGANVLTGSASTNWLMGGDGDDRLNGMGGDDVLYGDGGADTFVFGIGTGVDTVADFRVGIDKLDLSAFGFASFAALLEVVQDDGSGNSVIDLDGGDRVILRGVTKAQLSSGDMVLTAAGGAATAALFAAEAEPVPGLIGGFEHLFDAGPEMVRIGVIPDDALLTHALF